MEAQYAVLRGWITSALEDLGLKEPEPEPEPKWSIYDIGIHEVVIGLFTAAAVLSASYYYYTRCTTNLKGSTKALFF
jgi:hypothetical protein